MRQAAPRRLIAAGALALSLAACDDAPEQQAAAPPPAPPADFYTAPPPPPPPPPPPAGRLAGPAQIRLPTINRANAQSSTTTVSLHNAGGEPIVLQAVTVTGTVEVETAGNCAGQLAPGQPCSLTLTWTPAGDGPLSGAVVASSSHNSITIPLAGDQKTPPPPPPPQADMAQLRAMIAKQRLQQRLKEGPEIHTTPNTGPVFGPLIEWKTTDPDYKREETPGTTSSLPVDRNFILTMERNVTGVLLREVNSQLPGIVQVMTSQDIYGTDGKHRLLERGDIWLGRYKPLGKQGDTRLNVCFFRVIRLADGAHVYDSGDDCFAIATDAMGRTGLVGEVDNRIWERYGTAFVTAGIAAIAAAGVNATADQGNPAVSNSGNALSQNLGQVTARVIEQNINLAPVVTVANGERVNIQLLRDIYLRRPEEIKPSETKP